MTTKRELRRQLAVVNDEFARRRNDAVNAAAEMGRLNDLIERIHGAEAERDPLVERVERLHSEGMSMAWNRQSEISAAKKDAEKLSLIIAALFDHVGAVKKISSYDLDIASRRLETRELVIEQKVSGKAILRLLPKDRVILGSRIHATVSSIDTKES